MQKKVNILAEKQDSDIVIEVAENQEESEDYNSMYDSHLKPFSSENNSQIFQENLANEKFNPYVEDVFSLGMTILQTAYQCSG